MARSVAHLLTIFGADAEGHPLFSLECRSPRSYSMSCGTWEECGCSGETLAHCPVSPTGEHTLGEPGLIMPTTLCWFQTWDDLAEEVLAFVETQEARNEEWRGLWAVSFDMGEPESPAMQALACLTPNMAFRGAEVLLGDPASCVRFPLAGIEIRLQEAIEETIFVELDEDGRVEVDASPAVSAILPMIREA